MKSYKKHKINEYKKVFLCRKAKKKRKRISKKKEKNRKKYNKIIAVKKMSVPKIFSISENPEEVIKILKKIQTHC